MTYSDILKASSKSAKRKRKKQAAKKQAKSGWKAPAGYSPIPNSKKGGYRKMVGGKYHYVYPPAAGASSGASRDLPANFEADIVAATEKAKAAAPMMAKLAERLDDIAKAAGAAAYAKMIDLGQWYKKNHHELEEGIHGVKYASDIVQPDVAMDAIQSLSMLIMSLDDSGDE